MVRIHPGQFEALHPDDARGTLASLIGRRFATTLIAAALLALAACGEDREGSVKESGSGTAATGTTGTSTAPARPSGAVVAKVRVRETEFKLDPANPRIPKAGVVQFDVTNAGEAPHALEVEGPEGEVETETIAPGKKATLKADLSKAGTYVWYCPVGDHEQKGMKGRITVAGGGSGTSTERSGGRYDSRGRDDSGKGRDGSVAGGSDGHGGY